VVTKVAEPAPKAVSKRLGMALPPSLVDPSSQTAKLVAELIEGTAIAKTALKNSDFGDFMLNIGF
jgi:hypothetical protein